LDVALDDEVEILNLAGLELIEQALEGDARRGADREPLAAQTFRALLREITCVPVGFDHPGELAGRRRLVEAEDLDRIARLRVLELLALVVVERPHLAPGVSGDDG